MNSNRIKSYAKLLGKIPQTLRLAREGDPDEQERFDKEQVAPLHEQIERERRTPSPGGGES